MKRLTLVQKYLGILMVLEKANHPMSTHEIGKNLGFANGQPIRHVIALLYDDGLINAYREEMFGEWATFWTLKAQGAKALKKFRENPGSIELFQ